jgi:1-deoxy-D-xylulose-5-phosphate reductoisomerase
MEVPILYAFTHPDRIPDAGLPPFDPVRTGALTFEAVRHDAFPTLGLGIAAGRQGGGAPAVFNAANEEAVARFLDGTLRFGEIPKAIGSALDALGGTPAADRAALGALDAAARAHARNWRPAVLV